MSKGILIISCGPQHDALAARCINSIMRVSQLPIHLHRENLRGLASREAKTKMDLVTPFEYTLYLDCDTLVLKDPDYLLENFRASGDFVRAAVDPASPDSKAMAAHPFYKQTLSEEMLKELKLEPIVPHWNTGVILFRKMRDNVLFARWRMSWGYWKGLDEPCLMFAQRNWTPMIRPLDPRWNFLCNPEKTDDKLREGIRKAGVLHLCGINKAKSYRRITQLLLERGTPSARSA
jgi:hypothetical protein